MTAFFRQGDIVEFDLSPSRGHEAAVRRPGFDASSDEFNWSFAGMLDMSMKNLQVLG